jgi:hypothetical protein
MGQHEPEALERRAVQPCRQQQVAFELGGRAENVVCIFHQEGMGEKRRREEAWEGWILMKCIVAGENHSIPAWEFDVTGTEQTFRKCYYRWRRGLSSSSSARPEARHPPTRKYTNAALVGFLNSFRIFGSEHNLEPTGVQMASNHVCKIVLRTADDRCALNELQWSPKMEDLAKRNQISLPHATQ